MEGDHQARRLTAREAPRALGLAALAGALIATLAAVAIGFGLTWLGDWARRPGWAASYRDFLAAGGWWLLCLWGAAAGALARVPALATPGARAGALLGAAALVALPLVFKAQYLDESAPRIPSGAAAKRREILRWSYRSLAGLELTLDLTRDPDSTVREQAVIALGHNLVVTDLERADDQHPPCYVDSPLRGKMRDRLLEVLRGDSVEILRVEAGHALWLAPRAFGPQPEAAETLGAVAARGDSTRLGAVLARRALRSRPVSAARGGS